MKGESEPYTPRALKQCPKCNGSGLITKHKNNNPYDAGGRKLQYCPTCNGSGVV